MADASVQVVGASQFSVIGTDDAAGVIIRDNSSIAVKILIIFVIMSLLLFPLFKSCAFPNHRDYERLVLVTVLPEMAILETFFTHDYGAVSPSACKVKALALYACAPAVTTLRIQTI